MFITQADAKLNQTFHTSKMLQQNQVMHSACCCLFRTSQLGFQSALFNLMLGMRHALTCMWLPV